MILEPIREPVLEPVKTTSLKEVFDSDEAMTEELGSIHVELKVLSQTKQTYAEAVRRINRRIVALAKRRWQIEATLVGVTRVKPAVRKASAPVTGMEQDIEKLIAELSVEQIMLLKKQLAPDPYKTYLDSGLPAKQS